MINRPLCSALVGVGLAAVSAGCVPKEAAKDMDDTKTSSCLNERRMMENAVEAYFVLEGSNPSSEAQLVPNYLSKESLTMDLDADGNVVAAPGSTCI